MAIFFLGCFRQLKDNTAAGLGYFGLATHGARNGHAELMTSWYEWGSQSLWFLFSLCPTGPSSLIPPTAITFTAGQSTQALSTYTKLVGENRQLVTRTVLLKHLWEGKPPGILLQCRFWLCPGWGQRSCISYNSPSFSDAICLWTITSSKESYLWLNSLGWMQAVTRWGFAWTWLNKEPGVGQLLPKGWN